MLGTAPLNKEVYSKYIEGKKPSHVVEEESETIQEVDDRGQTGFHRDEQGLFIYDYFLKGYLKNAANVLKKSLRKNNLRAKVNDYVFIEPRRVHLGKAEPDGSVERPLRAMTMQGPRVSLAKSEMVDVGTTMEFEIAVLPHEDLCEDTIRALLDYGRFMGLGQWRNSGAGVFKVLRFEPLKGKSLQQSAEAL
jgi:hypothetical protein